MVQQEPGRHQRKVAMFLEMTACLPSLAVLFQHDLTILSKILPHRQTAVTFELHGFCLLFFPSSLFLCINQAFTTHDIRCDHYMWH